MEAAFYNFRLLVRTRELWVNPSLANLLLKGPEICWLWQQEANKMRVLITRPKAQAADFADQLRQIGAEAVFFPTVEI